MDVSADAVQDIVDDIHSTETVFDAVAPLARDENTLDDWVRGGASVVGVTIASREDCAGAMGLLGRWHRRLAARHDILLHVTRPEDMEKARREGKLGILFHFQGSAPLEKDLNLVEAYYQLGVRVIQLTYNVRGLVGDGCEESGDAGLSHFGRELVREMERVGMLVDLSHTGYRTTMEAMEESKGPVVFSHSNADAVYKSNRNIRDDQIKAVADKGGVIGVSVFPPMVSDSRPQPTMAELLAHVDYIASLVGTDHIGFGSDYWPGQHPYATPEKAREIYDSYLREGIWKPETYYPTPYVYVEGVETPDRLRNLTSALLEHGYSREDVLKILGGNFHRVYRQVWK